MYLIKVITLAEGQDRITYERVVGLYSTENVDISDSCIRLRTQYGNTEVEIPKDGKAYIMDMDGHTVDTYYG